MINGLIPLGMPYDRAICDLTQANVVSFIVYIRSLVGFSGSIVVHLIANVSHGQTASNRLIRIYNGQGVGSSTS